MIIKDFLKELKSLNSQEEQLEQALLATKQKKQDLFEQAKTSRPFEITLEAIIKELNEPIVANIHFTANIPTIERYCNGTARQLTTYRKQQLIKFMYAESEYASCFFSELRFEFTNKEGTTSSFKIPFDPHIKTTLGPCFVDLIKYHSDASSFGGMTFDEISIDIDGDHAKYLVLPITPEIVATMKDGKIKNAIISASIKKQEKESRLLEDKKDTEITK